MTHQTDCHQIGNATYGYFYHICDKCGKKHNETYYITEEKEELCPDCELKRIGKEKYRKIYIIDGDTDKIIAVINPKRGHNYSEAVKAITEGKEVWWAMNNVTGKFAANVYIVSRELQSK
ncbi:hypothetical protein [Paenibacillus tianjinensis]|uniref:Uncharacterized protein n=1 Tax=Paenibacillus tianjinensis TaxID=2810347 RepID=A0ABX7L7Y3_9BACL|nr:hypothetical protein [Paenibacillus tianjinensis]QSF43366.1 hypothetical protein JRJ22_19055 [Paenibacillus tianjinensis]